MVSTVAGFVETRCQEEINENKSRWRCRCLAARLGSEGYLQLLSLRTLLCVLTEESQRFTLLDQCGTVVVTTEPNMFLF